MLLAEVAPAAPAIDLAIGLWALAAVMLGIGLQRTWDYHIGAVLHLLASALDVRVWRINLNLGGPFEAANDRLQELLGQWVLAHEKALGLWWHANKQVVSYLGDSIVGFGEAVHGTIENLVYGTIPATVTAHTKPLRGEIYDVGGAARARDNAEARARSRGIDATHRDLTAEKLARERGIDNVGAKAKAYTDARVGRVQGQLAAERRYSHRILNRRLTWLEKALGVGALSGIAIAALTRVFPYWQCTNVRRFNRGVCRSPIGSLDWLFGLAAVAVVALNIEEIAELGQDLTDELSGLWETMTA